MYDVTIVMTTGKVFRFQTDSKQMRNQNQTNISLDMRTTNYFGFLLVMMEFI